MTSKSLSNSTLSLRFMQNAQRAKQLKEVELSRAEVQDDGKWEVGQAIRDLWGSSRDAPSESSDVHETSYLPFIFSASDEDTLEVEHADLTVRKVTGRRVFNKNGQEVIIEPAVNTASGTPTTSSLPTEPKGRKVHPRPKSISASGSSGQLRMFERPERSKHSDSKTARQTIFETGGVGVDLHTQARTDALSATFLKPTGIDMPEGLQTTSTALTSNSDNNKSARSEKKRERERDATAGEPGSIPTKPKRKRKKKNSE